MVIYEKVTIFISTLSVLLISCKKVEVRIIYSLSVNPVSIFFAADETTTKTVTITTDAVNWDAITMATWFTIVKQGRTLKLTPTANTETSERTATIKIIATEPAVTVTVTQRTVLICRQYV